MRCVHEASLHERNCFITLTYDDDHLPPGLSLKLKDYQDFMKRLRKRYGNGIRFYHAGEYGDDFQRPHYHALLFNHDFDDRVPWKQEGKFPLDRSAELEELWTFGHSSVGNVTFESAAYVARYITKKVTGEEADKHYEIMCPDTGEIMHRAPEYATMSRRPGIGHGWFDRWKSDAYPSDFIVMRGMKMRPPKFYETKLSEGELSQIKSKRVRQARKNAHDNTVERRRVKEKVKLAQISTLKRNLK